ncbi:MAG: family 78 glycoside hydrolase catalytic domain [Mariniphaga sp.]|nr:family 78 glycoside hydrolase catalytic domain [Mariniphaga sp.]MDD4425206.1 family 78 glycoside hydrolase catalytic domain [Mariniphaga sp.]
MRQKLLTGIFPFLFLFLIGFSSCNSTQDAAVTDLRVEYMNNPLGMDVSHPRFSWKMTSGERGVNQAAYRIIVSETRGEVEKQSGNIWDTGKVMARNSVNLAFEGALLESNKKYFWRVCVWIDEEHSYWSEPAFFHTGIMKPGEWQAEWITAGHEIVHESPLFRGEFEVEKSVEEAYAYVTACGFYEFYLNGGKVGDQVLSPSITDYRKTVLYSVFDVTSLLKKGKNSAGAMLGNGAWNLRKAEGRWSWGSGGASFGNPCFLMQLMITYKDGSQSVVITDNSWKTAPGPITFNNLYGGEDYDARKELPGWSAVGFDDAAWSQVATGTQPAGRLKSHLLPAIRVTQTLQPIKEIHPEPGRYIIDLGQNIAGWWRVEVKGAPGQVIRIRAEERLNNLTFPKPLEEGDKLSDNTRFHPYIWTDYTLAGNEQETYEPRFFYTGFRYLEVTTNDQKNLESLKVEGRVVHTDLERNGMFESSEPLFNQIHTAGLWSQRGNNLSYPTDCPHREKGAYTGDGQVVAEASIHDFHVPAYYTKWLNDMRDAQEENGRIPNTAPTLVGGGGGGIAWGSAYILIPWWMNHYFDDMRILEDHYPTMKKYIQYLKELGVRDEDPGEPYIIDFFDGYWSSLGEWCAPGQSDCPNHAVVNTFYYYYNSLLMSKIAGKLGYDNDSKYYRSLSDTVKQHFNRKFFNPETGLYGTADPYQTYLLLALMGDVVPEGYEEKVFQVLVEDIHNRDDHLNTGIIGTKYLWPVLVQGGEQERIYRLATQTTYPSYGYWIVNGSTTLLEEWSGESSHNHEMFGSITEYFFKFLAGIQSPLEGNTTAGYRNIHIEPYVPQRLEHVDASLETVAGTVVSRWKNEAGAFLQEVSLPANTTGTVVLPLFDATQPVVWEGDIKIWENNQFIEGVKGIEKAETGNGRISIHLGSGDYSFKVERR